jgi:serine/threonine-protein phosphatase 2B catalytic subunit
MEEIESPALMRLRNKPEAPRIDFTVYTQEDGSIVSTRDRVIKGRRVPGFFARIEN